jgi:uncharacterized Zn finger protein (UPF0148 family)
MMKFRCPHCRKLLETDEAAGKFLCPLCKKWSRLPPPKTIEAEEEILEVIAVPQEPRRERREAITDRDPNERRPRRRQDDEEEAVELDVVEEGDERPRRRKRRSRPRRRSSGAFDSLNLPLILLIVLAPMGLGIVALMFFASPLSGIASIFMVSGWIWFTLIAAEDGLGTALCVIFVPFYALYYATQNWDRVGLPAILYIIGYIGMAVGSAMAGRNNPGRRMQGAPPPIVRMLASNS